MDFVRQVAIELKMFGNAGATLSKVDSQISGIAKKTDSLVTGLASLFAVNSIKEFLKSGIEFGDQISDTSRRIGISTDQFQQWSFVAERAGLSAESVTKAFGFLNKSLGAVQLGLGDKKISQALKDVGVSVRDASGKFKPANEVMFELADRLKALPNDAQRVAIASSIFGKGGKDLALVLSQGSEELRKQMSLLEEYNAILGEDLVNAADAADDEMKLVNRSWQVFKSTVALGLLPVIKFFIRQIFSLIKYMKELSKTTSIVTAAVVSLGGALVLAAGKSLLAWTKNLVLFGLVAAAIFGVYLVFEDIYYFLSGKGQSAIEGWFKSFFGSDQAKADAKIKAIRTTFQLIVDDIQAAINKFNEFLTTMGRLTAGTALGAATGAAVGGAVGGPVGAAIGGTVGGIFGLAGGIINEKSLNQDKAAFDARSMQAFTEARNQGINIQGIGAPLNTNTNNNNVSIVVNGAKDPIAVGDEIERRINNMLTFTHQNFVTAKP